MEKTNSDVTNNDENKNLSHGLSRDKIKSNNDENTSEKANLPVQPLYTKNKKDDSFDNELSHVISVTLSHAYDINDKSDRFYGLSISDIKDAIGKTKISMIYSLLYIKPNLTRKQISIKLDVPLNTITVTMNRNSDRFIESGNKDKSLTYKLSDLGIKDVEEKLEKYTKVKESINKSERKKREDEYNELELEKEFNELFEFIKPEINNDLITFDFEEIMSYSPKLSNIIIDNPIRFIDAIL